MGFRKGKAMSDDSLDIRDQLARIDRALAESDKLREETRKYAAEQRKLESEARYYDRHLWQIVIAAMTALGVWTGAVAAAVKLLSG
jgi:hypothetical protein